MKRSLYIYHDGELSRKDNTLRYITNQGEKRDIPIETVSEINVMGQMKLNTSLINLLGNSGIVLHFFNYYDFYTGSFYPRETLLSGELLIKQVQHYSDYEKRLYLARKFVEGAADNIYRNIRYYNGRGKDLDNYLKTVEDLKKELPKAETIEALMGYEGNIHKTYYEAWNIIIDSDIDFTKRVRNPPDNLINTMISFVNMMIYTKVLTEIYQTQLNPTISYLHVPGTRRFSLSLDLAEIFKPLIGDRLIFAMLNRKQISEKSFTKKLNYLHLTQDASRQIAQELDTRLAKTIQHKELGKKVSYRHLIRLECYKLIKHLLDEKEYEPFKIWW